MNEAEKTIWKRQRINGVLYNKARIRARGDLGGYDRLTGINGLGKTLAKQLAEDLMRLSPAEWSAAYPDVRATKQQIYTAEHCNLELESIFEP